MNFRSVHSYNVVVDVRCSYAIKSNCAQFNFVFVVLLFSHDQYPHPEDTHLMNLVLIESMDKFIHDECKANCEACQVNSDSQFDHCPYFR